MDYLGMLVPTQVDFDHVLTNAVIDKLHKYNALSEYPSEQSFWTIEYLPFYYNYPYVKFHDKKIPAYYNHPAIVVYLGFRAEVGVDIFMRLYSRTVPTRAKTLAAVHAHIDTKWAGRTHTGASFDTPAMADTVMSYDLGLTRETIEEVKLLGLEFDRNAGIFQDYFDKNHSKNFENLKLVDFVHELINKRMAKLEGLNDVCLRHLR